MNKKVLSKEDYTLYLDIVTKTEEQLRCYLAVVLQKYYNEVIVEPEYIVTKGIEPVALVAHLDTVFPFPPHAKDIFYDRERNAMWSMRGGLGDDRLGVFMIIRLLTTTAMRPSIIFTLGEESGGIGATALVNDFPHCPVNAKFFIQLDRQGYKEAVFYYCYNQDFISYICNYGFVETPGIFSDISILCPSWGIAGTNLSVGYINEHTTHEIVSIDAMWYTFFALRQIVADSLTAPDFIYTSYPCYCDKCGEQEDPMFLFLDEWTNKQYCFNCRSDDATWCEVCEKPFIDHMKKGVCRECSRKNNAIQY